MFGVEGSGPDGEPRWRSYLRAAATKGQAELLIDLLERLIAEFQVVPRPPATGSRPYLNLFPPAAFGSTRIGNLAISSQRFHSMPEPGRLEQHLRAVPRAEPAEGKYLTTYVHTAADFEIASAILRCAFEDRAEKHGLQRSLRMEGQATPESPEPGALPPAVREPSGGPAVSTPAAPARVDLPAEQVARAQRIASSARYRSQLRALAQGAPDDARVTDTLALLLTRGGRASFHLVSQRLNMPERRVQGYLARLGTLLTVDGSAPLTLDIEAREVRLDTALVESLFDL